MINSVDFSNFTFEQHQEISFNDAFSSKFLNFPKLLGTKSLRIQKIASSMDSYTYPSSTPRVYVFYSSFLQVVSNYPKLTVPRDTQSAEEENLIQIMRLYPHSYFTCTLCRITGLLFFGGPLTLAIFSSVQWCGVSTCSCSCCRSCAAGFCTGAPLGPLR